MPNFDPNTVPVGGTVRGRFSGERYFKVGPGRYQHSSEASPRRLPDPLRDKGRHVDPDRPVDTKRHVSAARWDAAHRKPGSVHHKGRHD